jgi:hypothetical protein
MVVDRHTAQHPAPVAARLPRMRLRSGTYPIDDHHPHDRCHHCRLAIVDDQETLGAVYNHAGDDRLPHPGSRRPMHRPDNLFTQLDAAQDQECPRFQLQRRPLSLGGIFAEGYQVTTTLRGVRFRFTAPHLLGGSRWGGHRCARAYHVHPSGAAALGGTPARREALGDPGTAAARGRNPAQGPAPPGATGGGRGA